ncbi:zinc finger, C2H2 type [Ancylostoma duodenale]|uniref:Zinc finger, C2H2 type n=1 Tax=Ancylostoma duodenale TaxID=51022 RepID=A0A0C2CBH0_9BILA|nr:zinc finger, C2H2 type [Ancylostoma duodenale]
MLTHTGERAFKCKHDGCNKAFSLEANLKSHIKTHTGEKSYKCSYCNHAFTHPYNLRVHISRRHKLRNEKHPKTQSHIITARHQRRLMR